MNRNTKRKLKLLRKTNPNYFKTQPRKSHRPKVAGKNVESRIDKEETGELH